MARTSLALGLVAALAGMALSPQAAAVTVTRDYFSHGTASCQSALPVFDGNIRKRPLAVANEGTANAFVTCDSASINNAATGFSAIAVYLRNRAGVEGVTVSCTLVNGVFTGGSNFTKTSTAITVSGVTAIAWDTTDNAGNNFVAPAVSCALPPGVDISAYETIYPEDVGA